jgi:glutaconate CoA-transferase subunit A
VFECPLTGQNLVAVPAATIDVVIIHVNVADTRGNALIFGDPFIDPLLVRAAERVWITAEKIVDKLPSMDQRPAATFISRMWVKGVIAAPKGGGFTEVFPERPWDRDSAKAYQRNSIDTDWMKEFSEVTASVLGPPRP